MPDHFLLFMQPYSGSVVHRNESATILSMTNHIVRYDVQFDYAGKKTSIQVTFADGSTRGADGRASGLIDSQSTVDLLNLKHISYPQTNVEEIVEVNYLDTFTPGHINSVQVIMKNGDIRLYQGPEFAVFSALLSDRFPRHKDTT